MPTPIPFEVIAETTSAVTTEAEFIIQQRFIPATVVATNLDGAESVAVLFSVDGGNTFEPLSQNGADLVLTATTNTFAVLSPLVLGFTKTSTATAGGVFVMANQTP